MKLPKISSITDSIATSLRNRKLQRMQNHVRIHDINTYGDSFGQLYNAREILGNYAMHKGVLIDIYRGERYLPESLSETNGDILKDKLFLKITNKKNGKQKLGLVDADTNKIYKHEVVGYTFEETSDETQIVKKHVLQTCDDTFLRNLYRKIEKLTNELKPKKK